MSSGQHRAPGLRGGAGSTVLGAQICQLEIATPHKMLSPPCTEIMCVVRDVLITWEKGFHYQFSLQGSKASAVDGCIQTDKDLQFLGEQQV